MPATSARDERPRAATTLRLAVSQSTVSQDPTDRVALRAAGQEIRALPVEAAEAGARLVQFSEGAVTYPSKRVMAAGRAGEEVWTQSTSTVPLLASFT